MKNKSVIVDLDGTVCMKKDRGWYDFSKVDSDTPIAPIVDLVKQLHIDGYKIVFCTAREEYSMQKSLDWIRRHIFMDERIPVEIYMRKDGDRRPDTIVKKEIYKNMIEPRHNVWFVLEDRDSVVGMWRNDLGLTCLQVVDGDY